MARGAGWEGTGSRLGGSGQAARERGPGQVPPPAAPGQSGGPDAGVARTPPSPRPAPPGAGSPLPPLALGSWDVSKAGVAAAPRRPLGSRAAAGGRTSWGARDRGSWVRAPGQVEGRLRGKAGRGDTWTMPQGWESSLGGIQPPPATAQRWGPKPEGFGGNLSPKLKQDLALQFWKADQHQGSCTESRGHRFWGERRGEERGATSFFPLPGLFPEKPIA